MNADETSPAAAFIGRVNEFLALQSHFRRRFNLAPAHWLTLHSALASVRFEHGHWICDEFSTTDVTRYSLTSRETIRRSLHWLLAKGLVIRQRRRYVVSPLALGEIRNLLELPHGVTAEIASGHHAHHRDLTIGLAGDAS